MNNNYRLLLVFILFSFLSFSQQPGDEIEIQTIEFDGYPVGSGWLAPREGYFDFTSLEGLDFEKVYIKYKLKCDPTQNPSCGEWDYLSYLKVIEHTGKGLHPNYYIGGAGGLTPATFSYMNNTAWEYAPRYEQTIVFDTPDALSEHEIGTGALVVEDPFNAALEDSHVNYLFRQSELAASGLTEGNITGMQFNILDTGGEMQNVRISMKATFEDELQENEAPAGLVEVFAKDVAFDASGWQQLDFAAFFNWNGFSNIIVSVAFTGATGASAVTLNGTSYGWNCASKAASTDSYFNFNGPDKIEVPTTNLDEIDNEVTISFWLNGNGEQPQNDSVFDVYDQDGNRVLNIHLPWSNQRVYWDAGDASGYDRIDKEVDNIDQFKGVWNHWAFTKNATTGVMNIYLNGVLWHTGSGLDRSIGEIASFKLGRGQGNADNFYDGKLDDFQIWSKELDAATIANWMHRDVDASHPSFSDLKLNYRFDEVSTNYETLEAVTAQQTPLYGIPQLKNFQGEHFKNFTTSTTRPNVKFNKNTSPFTISNELVIDSIAKGKVMVEKYVQLVPGEIPVLDQTLYVNPTYYNNYLYDANLVATDSTAVAPDFTLILEQIEYNTTAPGEEVLVPWEIGRYITPYGNGLSLGDDGWTWIFDVTDFQHLFQGDDVHIRAGNFQELLDMKVVFKVGTPSRDVLGIQSLYSGNYSLNTFDEVVVNTTVPLNPDAEMFSVKSTLTGHDFGAGNNCGEFCNNTHKVLVNGVEQYSWQIMQECGENPLYPQGGTWMYDRAGWCPGAPATVQNLDITPFINVGVDTTTDIDYDINQDPYGNYITEIFFVEYGAPNFSNDASLEEIIAPNIFKLNTRFNPTCGEPIIKIKNNGENTLETVTITYGVSAQESYSHTWTGSLAFLEEAVITLPAVEVGNYYEGVTNFEVSLSNPNGAVDQYEFNNSLVSQFEPAPIHDEQMVIEFKTNNRPYENSYKVFDTAGNIMFERDFDDANTTYTNLINLPPGCYELVVYDTGGDGMNSWPSNHGNGIIRLKNYSGSTIIFLERWFGESLKYLFRNDAVLSTEDQVNTLFSVYPNPADNAVTVSLVNSTDAFSMEVFNITGMSIYKQENMGPTNNSVDVSSYSSGVYLLSLKTANGNTQVKKLIVN
tara:strand:+ start:7635 stop:11066 length:3432 start_codon:yes stop_codon:yes gene_type:complete